MQPSAKDAASPEDAETLAAAWDQLLYVIGNAPSQSGQYDLAAETATTKIPVTVLSGFLGAGKTTLLCALLEQTDCNLLAIVNDLASVNIDAALVRSTSAETMELENGCACCVLGNDLDELISEVGQRSVRPDAIIIESSGISDPMGFAHTIANNAASVLDGIVTVVDATNLANQLADTIAAPLLARQLNAAHIIALSKTTEADDIDALRNGLSKLAPGRPVFVLNQLDGGLAELMLGASLRGARLNPTKQPHEYSGFSPKLISANHQPNAVEFFALMSEIPSSVYRIKGDVSLIERQRETHYRFQAVGQHWRVETLADASTEPQLVVIGERENSKYEKFFIKLTELLATNQT